MEIILCELNQMENNMQELQSKFMECDVRETYSDAVLKQAWSKYSFDFKIDGMACPTWYDPQRKKKLCFECSDAAELFDLTQEVELGISQSKFGFATLDVRKFLCKHLQAMIKVEQELQRAPASECHYEVSDLKPVDMDKLSLEDQCLFEVIQEQSEKANQAAAANGTPDDVKYEVTKEMVKTQDAGESEAAQVNDYENGGFGS
jgi:hypothetical protein